MRKLRVPVHQVENYKAFVKTFSKKLDNATGMRLRGNILLNTVARAAGHAGHTALLLDSKTYGAGQLVIDMLPELLAPGLQAELKQDDIDQKLLVSLLSESLQSFNTTTAADVARTAPVVSMPYESGAGKTETITQHVKDNESRYLENLAGKLSNQHSPQEIVLSYEEPLPERKPPFEVFIDHGMSEIADLWEGEFPNLSVPLSLLEAIMKDTSDNKLIIYSPASLGKSEASVEVIKRLRSANQTNEE